MVEDDELPPLGPRELGPGIGLLLEDLVGAGDARVKAHHQEIAPPQRPPALAVLASSGRVGKRLVVGNAILLVVPEHGDERGSEEHRRKRIEPRLPVVGVRRLDDVPGMEDEVDPPGAGGVVGDGARDHGQPVPPLPLPLRIGEDGERDRLSRKRGRPEVTDWARRDLRSVLDDHAVHVLRRRVEPLHHHLDLAVRAFRGCGDSDGAHRNRARGVGNHRRNLKLRRERRHDHPGDHHRLRARRTGVRTAGEGRPRAQPQNRG